MKAEIRVIGIDDAPFSFEDATTPVIGVVMRGGSYIEGILRTDVAVDGIDATEKLSDMLVRSRYREQLKAVIIDGAALGGFNVVNTEQLYKNCGIPIIVVTRNRPNDKSVMKALRDHFDDWASRWATMSRGEIFEMKTEHKPIYVKRVGLSVEEAIDIVQLCTVRGALPEPIRIAHLIAAGIKRGESYGRA